jgi:hypothetical protein
MVLKLGWQAQFEKLDLSAGILDFGHELCQIVEFPSLK